MLSRTTALLWVSIVTASGLATAIATTQPVGPLGREDAHDHPHSHEILTLDVTTFGAPPAAWGVRALGTVGLPAPAAALTLRVLEGGAGPLAAAEPWERTLDLAAGDGFDERFLVDGAAEGTVLELAFRYEAPPEYTLARTYRILVEQAPDGLAARAELQVAPQPGLGDLEPLVVPAEGPSEVAAMGTMGFTGTAFFRDPVSSTYYRCRYCFVYVYDWDGGIGDDYYGGVGTDINGYFSYTHENIIDEDGTRADVYVRLVANGDMGRLYKPWGGVWGAYYEASAYSPYVWWDVPNDTMSNLGSIYLAEDYRNGQSDLMRKAFWIHRALTTSWHEARYNGPNFNAGAVIAYYPVDGYFGHTASSSPEYHAGGDIHLASPQWGSNTASHEWGHYLMYKGYGNWWDPTTNCSRCAAWRDGWAFYVSIETWNNPVYTYSDGTTSYNFETRTCSGGDTSWWCVGQTLWDLVDSTNDGYDQGIDYALSHLWTAFVYAGGRDQNFANYYANWTSVGYSGTNFKNAAKQNTIIYP